MKMFFAGGILAVVLAGSLTANVAVRSFNQPIRSFLTAWASPQTGRCSRSGSDGCGPVRCGRRVKCDAGVGGDGDRLGGLVLALGVGHSVPVWTGEFAAGGR